MNKKRALARTNPLLLQGICHRGLHNDTFSENGMLAFSNAIEHHMAFELDVHLTKDGKLIVSHDSNLLRMTGKEGIIEELTSSEIRNSYQLPDGGDIPLLEEVLTLTNERVPIVIELKSYKNNYKALSKAVKTATKNIQNKSSVAFISFDPRTLLPFLGKGYAVQFLVCEKYANMFKYAKFFPQLDIEYTMLNQERVQKYAKNHLVNTWTIESNEVFDASLPYIDMVTFQLMDESYIRTKMKEKHFL